MIKLPILNQRITNSTKVNQVRAAFDHKSEPSPNNFEVIIGCDNFLRILTGEVQKIDENLGVLKTRAGLAFMGSQRGANEYGLCNFAIDQ